MSITCIPYKKLLQIYGLLGIEFPRGLEVHRNRDVEALDVMFIKEYNSNEPES
jgi:hypothetical protein